MAKTWKVQEAKAQFSALIDSTLAEGPQVVTRRGVETAVVVSFEQWRRLQRPKYTDVKEWLLAPEARTEDLAPPPVELTLPPPPDFE